MKGTFLEGYGWFCFGAMVYAPSYRFLWALAGLALWLIDTLRAVRRNR